MQHNRMLPFPLASFRVLLTNLSLDVTCMINSKKALPEAVGHREHQSIVLNCTVQLLNSFSIEIQACLQVLYF